MATGMPGFFDIDERLKELSAQGGDLERIKAVVDSEMFRPALEAPVPRHGHVSIDRGHGRDINTTVDGYSYTTVRRRTPPLIR